MLGVVINILGGRLTDPWLWSKDPWLQNKNSQETTRYATTPSIENLDFERQFTTPTRQFTTPTRQLNYLQRFSRQFYNLEIRRGAARPRICRW